jgi:TetR/AcrR family transcriptional regulator, tetracycline repressor protein
MAVGVTRTGQRGFLSRELIVEQALALLDEDGPGALSMRRLADRLGVAPNALYTHVRGKADLVEALIDQVDAGLDLGPDPAGDWTEQLAALSRSIRRHLLAHPAVVPFALQQPGLGPHGLRLGEAVYAVLRPAGFSDQTVVGTVYALLTYILGFVALEIPRAGTDPQTSDEFVRRLQAFFVALPAGEFPHTVALAPCWPASPPTTSSSSASPPSWPASRPSRPAQARARRARAQPARSRATWAPAHPGPGPGRAHQRPRRSSSSRMRAKRRAARAAVGSMDAPA